MQSNRPNLQADLAESKQILAGKSATVDSGCSDGSCECTDVRSACFVLI